MGTPNLRYATEFQINYITLISSMVGGEVDLMPMLVELNLFEDIYSTTISGKLVISDALGLISNFRLNGSEFIRVSLSKYSGDEHPIIKTFRVFKISDRSLNKNNSYEVYTLDFCSEEYLFSEQYRISRSFKNYNISDIIATILTDYVQLGKSGTKSINIENTKNTYDFILPNKKIFETITWLANYAMPESKNPGADMLFYENMSGYHFKSLQTLFQKNSYQTYVYNPKNISSEVEYQFTNVQDFEVLNFFDTLNGISLGTFANKTITLDILQRKKKTDNFFSYADYQQKAKKLNSSGVVSDYQNRRGEAMDQMLDNMDLEMGALRMATGNSRQKLNQFVINSDPNSIANDIFIEEYMKHRVAQLGLINYTRIKIVVPGDTWVEVGHTVDFITFGVSPVTYTKSGDGDERKPDPFYSGKYLVTAVRHVVKDKSYITVLELSKDSSDTPYASSPNSDPKLKDIIAGVEDV